jgi:Do/DeqQ family serine protease
MTAWRTRAMALMCGVALSATAALAQGDVVPPDVATMKMSFAPIVRRVAPAVVNVYSKRMVRQQVDPFWAMFNGGATSRERIQQSLGSGSIVRADGLILTNHHNIESATEIRVVTSDRREWPATVLLDDPRADLAVLKIDTKGERLPTIRVDAAADPQVGDLVLAVGDPFGVGQTVTNGIVSAKARSDIGAGDYASFLQTDASINPGNSGGPLVDMAGDLIGVNTAIVSSSGASAGVGFAIPAAVARQVIETAARGGHEVVRPWLGAKTQALTPEMAKSLGLASVRGVVVTDVWPTGPAAHAGIVRGDVIQSVDGDTVDDDRALTFAIGAHRPGDGVTLMVARGVTPRALRLTVDAPPNAPAPDPRLLTGRNPLSGATVANLSPAEAYRLRLDPFAAHGVLVTKVGAGYGQSIGVRPGDFIRAVNGQPISSTGQLEGVLSTPTASWALSIERGGQTITARFSA